MIQKWIEIHCKSKAESTTMKGNKKNLRGTSLFVIGLVALSGFWLSVNSQPVPLPTIKVDSLQIEKQNSQVNNFKQISILDQILLGCIPIFMGMSSMALFTLLQVFLRQYSIKYLVNLKKTIQADSLKKKI